MKIKYTVNPATVSWQLGSGRSRLDDMNGCPFLNSDPCTPAGAGRSCSCFQISPSQTGIQSEANRVVSFSRSSLNS